MKKMKSPPACVNLKERFGHKYKVEYEESYYAEYGANAQVEDPWLMVIPCKNGHICPWGDENLAACTNNSGPVASRLRRHPLVTVAQDGDDGVNALFNAEHFDEIAAIMKPRRQRQIPEAERERLRMMSAKYGFQRIVQNPQTERQCVQKV